MFSKAAVHRIHIHVKSMCTSMLSLSCTRTHPRDVSVFEDGHLDLKLYFKKSNFDYCNFYKIGRCQNESLAFTCTLLHAHKLCKRRSSRLLLKKNVDCSFLSVASF